MEGPRQPITDPVWPRLPRRAKYLPHGLKRLLPAGLRGLPAASLDVGAASDGRRALYYDGSLQVAGWFLFGPGAPPVSGRVLVDGVERAALAFAGRRPDVCSLFGIDEDPGPVAFDLRVPLGASPEEALPEGGARLRLELEATAADGRTHTMVADVDVCRPSAAEAQDQRLGDLEAWQEDALAGAPDRDRLAAILPVAVLERPDAEPDGVVELGARFDDRLEVVGFCLRLDPASGPSALDLCGPPDTGRGRLRLIGPDNTELAACDLIEAPEREDLAERLPTLASAGRSGFRALFDVGGYRGPARLELALPIPGSEHLFVEQRVEITAGDAMDHAAQRRAHLDELDPDGTTELEALLPVGELDVGAELSVRHDETVELEGWVLLPGDVAPSQLGVFVDGVRIGTLTGGRERPDLEDEPHLGSRLHHAGFAGRVRTLGRRGDVDLVVAVDPEDADPLTDPAGAPWATRWPTKLVAHTPARWNVQKLREFDPRDPTPARQMIAHYPLQLFVEFTTACQLSCLMCRHGSKVKDVPTNQYLDDDHVKALVNVLPHLQRLNMFGWGEATLHRRYTEFLQDARLLNPDMEIAVTSHFNKVTDELIETLIRAEITSIVISVDGASKDVYEYVRRRGDYEKVTTNIKRLVDRRNELGASHPHVVMEFVIQKANIAELVPFVELVHDLGVDDVILEPVAAKSHLVPDYGAHLEDFAAAKVRADELGVNLRGLGVSRFEEFIDGWEEANFDLSAYSPSTMTAITLDMLEAEDVDGAAEAEFTPQPDASPAELAPLLDVDALAAGGGPEVTGPVSSRSVDFDPYVPMPPPPRGETEDLPCYEPWQTAYINADGTITPCCWSSRVLGRLSEASPEAIWLGDAAATLRREMLANDLDPICKRCVAMGRARERMDT